MLSLKNKWCNMISNAKLVLKSWVYQIKSSNEVNTKRLEPVHPLKMFSKNYSRELKTPYTTE